MERDNVFTIVRDMYNVLQDSHQKFTSGSNLIIKSTMLDWLKFEFEDSNVLTSYAAELKFDDLFRNTECTTVFRRPNGTIWKWSINRKYMVDFSFIIRFTSERINVECPTSNGTVIYTFAIKNGDIHLIGLSKKDM